MALGTLPHDDSKVTIMTVERVRAAVQLSRRDWLRHATTAIAGIAIFGSTAKRANSAVKMSQKVVAYQDHPEGEKRCDRCVHFQPPNSCNIIDGEVKPDGYCRFFVVRSRA